jgi:arylsulfatase A-like enzyme
MSQLRPDSLPLPKALFLIAVWLALAAGLAEAALSGILSLGGWHSWVSLNFVPSRNLFWAAPVFNLIVFTVVALLLWPVCVLIRRRWDWFFPAVVVLASLGAYALTSLPDRLRVRAEVVLALGMGVVAARWLNRSSRRVEFLRRTLVPLVVLVALLGAGARASLWLEERRQLDALPQAPQAPNVLLIVLDTLRQDRVGAYGYPRPTTPFLDRFARQGVLFENAFAPSSWTLPSHASLFTGTLPQEHGAILWPMDNRLPMLAEKLTAQGYVTAGFSANSGICNRPFGLTRGFVHWEGTYFGLLDSLLRTSLGLILKDPFRKVSGNPRDPLRLTAPQVHARFLRWLDGRPQRPFFVFLNYMEVHMPLGPPCELARKFAPEAQVDCEPGWWPGNESARMAEGKETQGAAQQPFWRLYSDFYDASLAYLDGQLEELFAELDRRELDKNLLVIITSDHGESLGEHGFSGHRQSLYPEEIRVPLIFWFPGRIPAGARVKTVVGLEHIPATLEELLAISLGRFPGNSLAGSWQGQPPMSDQGVSIAHLGKLTEHVLPTYRSTKGWQESVVDSRWHYIIHQTLGEELYDWNADPRYQHNLMGTEEGQRAVEELRRKLEARLGDHADSRR